MIKVLIHAGFHKTATTSVQRTLTKSRPVLKDTVKIAALKPLTATRRSARRYSETKSVAHLLEFTANWQRDLERIFNDLDGRKLIVSSEEFSGHLPGRPKVRDYSAAPTLCAEMLRSLTAFVPAENICFYFSTRSADGWLRSAYNEHVKASALMTMDWVDYQAQFANSLDIDPIICDISTAVSPATVQSRHIENLPSKPNDILQPILDILAIPMEIRNQMPKTVKTNESLPETMTQALLEINRAGGDHDLIKERKQAMIREYWTSLA